jgi:hypothetical protein
MLNAAPLYRRDDLVSFDPHALKQHLYGFMELPVPRQQGSELVDFGLKPAESVQQFIVPIYRFDIQFPSPFPLHGG